LEYKIMNTMERPKIVIIGGGFAGLNAAKSLKNTAADILLIDKANHHLFQPLLYQVATSALSSDNIATPLRQVLAKQANVRVLLADITNINKVNKQVIAANGDIFDYDYLILAPGANHSYFNHPEWEAVAPGLKTLFDAMEIRNKILLSYERAERCMDAIEAEKFICFVVVGGGPTGVEMAGAIAEMAHKSLVGNFRKIKPEKSKIYLIEGTSQILPSFPRDLAEKAQKKLESMGVQVLLNTLVTQISEKAVWIGEQIIETPNVIWAAGNEASPLIKLLNIPLDGLKRAIVNTDLTIPGHSEIFVIGDAACCYDKRGKALPGIAPVAIQQGHFVAKLLRNEIQDKTKARKPFVYFDKGMMATIGKNEAVAVVGKFKMSGHFAWLAWCVIHIFYLISFSNRILVMIQWLFLYFSNRRRVRLITQPVTEEDDPLHTYTQK
jgi:NADH dehydrogenase